MLKIALTEEERRGAEVLAWWNGHGAARVIAYDGDGLLMERALGDGSLVRMARDGRDDEAARILCATVAALHARRDTPPATAVPLEPWFAALWPAAERHGGILARAASEARALLDAPREVVVLHGDVHHDNVLDFGARGWLAIDPKGLVGERAYDLANLFFNPDADVALTPGRLTRLADVVSEAARVDHERLMRWVIAYGGLSAAWSLEDGEEAGLAQAVLERAIAALEMRPPARDG